MGLASYSPLLTACFLPLLLIRFQPFSFSRVQTAPQTELGVPVAHIFQSDPLVIYLPSFLSSEEIHHLRRSSEGNYEVSQVWSREGGVVKETIRRSESAHIPSDDITRAIEVRAKSFLGWRSNYTLQPLVAQKYPVGGHFRAHYDWADDTVDGDGNLAVTFMTYLEANCTGGGTRFPRLSMPTDPRWCEFIECDSPKSGVTFKAIEGNAIFWENLRSDGSGHPATLHSGEPVESGSKIGLNIWFWDWNAPGTAARKSA